MVCYPKLWIAILVKRICDKEHAIGDCVLHQSQKETDLNKDVGCFQK